MLCLDRSWDTGAHAGTICALSQRTVYLHAITQLVAIMQLVANSRSITSSSEERTTYSKIYFSGKSSEHVPQGYKNAEVATGPVQHTANQYDQGWRSPTHPKGEGGEAVVI